MIVKFIQNVVDNTGRVLAMSGTTGTVLRLIGSTKYHVKFDTPVTADSECVVPMQAVEVMSGGLRGLVSRVITTDEIDLSNYEWFKSQCDESKGSMNYVEALQMAKQAATIATYIAGYKALLNYTEASQDKDVKTAFSKGRQSSMGSSQDKREDEARQTLDYQDAILKLAQTRSAQEIVNVAYDYCINMYYLFREVYKGEKSTLMSTDPHDRF